MPYFNFIFCIKDELHYILIRLIHIFGSIFFLSNYFSYKVMYIVEPALPMTKAALPMTKAALPLTKAALPVTKAALSMTKAALPITKIRERKNTFALRNPDACQYEESDMAK